MHTNLDNAVHLIDNLPFRPPEREILRRLGYDRAKTRRSPSDMKMFREVVSRTAALCRCRGAYRLAEISRISGDGASLKCGGTLPGASISKFLSGAKFAVVMGVTAGGEVAEEISSLFSGGEARKAEAVIMDAAASEIADAAMDGLNDILRKMLEREGLAMGKTRFSPGFGDFPLGAQKFIFTFLELINLELRLTESCQMVPEKSVTAVAAATVKTRK